MSTHGDAIVISGLGVVGASGIGRESLADALFTGRVDDREIDRREGFHRRGHARRAATCAHLALSRVVPPAQGRRMSPSSRFAVAATRLALEEARLSTSAAADGDRTGVCLATTLGPAVCTQRLLDEIFGAGPETCSPFLFMESVANAPSAQIAIACGSRAMNATITQREAGPLLALAEAQRAIVTRRATRVLAGVVDEVIPLNHAILNGFRALARPIGALPEAARPFDRRRNGFLLAEGAAVVVVERESDAIARGARVQARVNAVIRANDKTAPAAGFGDGADHLATRLLRGLEHAGIAVGSIDRVVSGASGARRGDAIEAAVLRRVFAGRTMPPVLAPKAVAGEYAGGHFAAGVLAAAGARFGATPNATDPDPALGVRPHDGSELPPPRCVLVTSVAAGGAAAFAILEAP